MNLPTQIRLPNGISAIVRGVNTLQRMYSSSYYVRKTRATEWMQQNDSALLGEMTRGRFLVFINQRPLLYAPNTSTPQSLAIKWVPYSGIGVKVEKADELEERFKENVGGHFVDPRWAVFLTHSHGDSGLIAKVNPVSICLVQNDTNTHLLLVQLPRSRPGVYTCVSGFGEPGEMLEETTRREVDFNRSELSDARWFSRQEVQRAHDRSFTNPTLSLELEENITDATTLLFIPPKGTLSHKLISDWLQGISGDWNSSSRSPHGTSVGRKEMNKVKTQDKNCESIDMSASVVREDPCSCGNFNDLKISHIGLKWILDFDRQTIRGSATLHLHVLQDNVTELRLDSRGLKVERIVETTTPEEEVTWREEQSQVKAFGSKLILSLLNTYNKGHQFCLRVDYETARDASALQWLRAEQTAGQQHPYMFSQCQAIHARSLLPCMDTPAVKQSYDAEVSVPKPLLALMSALRDNSGHDDLEVPGNIVYKFIQKVPIPSYLLAVVVGKLERREIGPRSAVWSEVELVDKAAEEFSETESMLSIAEELLGPYVWGRYDILVLPPSFPFGGMENPCLTFATPTLLAGDKSLANVIAHEISHSWTGNLVTNATWDHFWLNEGFTTFAERKITGRVMENKFPGTHSEAHRQILALNGLTSLENAITEQFDPSHKHTCLIWDVKNDDPDDAFSTVPYEKGHTFLFMLEQKVGVEKFEKWLKVYLDHFKYQSITTEDWRRHFLSYFKEEEAKGVFKEVDWEKWFHSPGMPVHIPQYNRSLCDEPEALAHKWVATTKDTVASMTGETYSKFLPIQREEFLAALLKESPLEHFKLEAMQQLYDLNNTQNSEIRLLWTRLAIKAHWEPIIPKAIEFVTVQGRMKFTRPVYRDLYLWEFARPKATENFNANRKFMHNTTAMLVAKDMKLDV